MNIITIMWGHTATVEGTPGRSGRTWHILDICTPPTQHGQGFILASSRGHSQLFNVHEKNGNLVCDGTWATFHLEPTWNRLNYAWERTPFLGLPAVISSLMRVFRSLEVRSDNKARSVNKSESYQRLFQMYLTSWLGWSRAVADQALPFLSWTLKSW